MAKCKNCDHLIRSLTIFDNSALRKSSKIYTHSKHSWKSAICLVKEIHLDRNYCGCNNPEPIKEQLSQPTPAGRKGI
jgi:Txe/YoeB family toxin of Txe-Axe toxin-antitoxin module